MAKIKNTADRELAAMASILKALDGLDGESIQRVFDYVLGRLSISPQRVPKSAPSITSTGPSGEQARVRKTSIRDLKDEKKPESSNQMAALVAYYLSEVAESDESKQTVNTADLERYFKQAGFKLPKVMSGTLPNAAAAGYFDAVGNGQYRLNAVGYNLVAHALPRLSSATPKKKKAKKTKR
jgi:hypothetical protein